MVVIASFSLSGCSESISFDPTHLRPSLHTPTATPAATKLIFSVATQSEVTWTCTAITVSRQDASSNPFTSGVTTVNFSGTSALFFSNSSCSSSITSAAIIDTTSSITVYVWFTAAGSKTITAAATSLTSGTQSNTVTLDPFTWTGTFGDQKWSTATNWSGGVAPTSSGQHAVFDSNCTICNATVDVGVSSLSIDQIYLHSTYVGSITQGTGNTITLNSFNQDGGTFIGGNASITSLAVNLAGGTFTSTSGNFTLGGHNGSAVIANTFHANAGTVTTAGDFNGFKAGGIQLNRLVLVGNNLNLYGTILVSGDLSVTANSNISGPGKIKLNGSGLSHA